MNSTKMYLVRNGVESPTSLTFVRVAKSFFARLVGLLSRKSLPDNEGLLITPCASIHTIGMRFTIDVVFLDKQNKVLAISKGIKPFRIAIAPRGTVSVLEVSDGNVKKTGIHLDDTLLFD